MHDLKNHIEKYLKGELSSTEMHALEMKALHDPFLAEALEGAASIRPDHFAKDVQSINKKIATRKTNRFYWPLRIAASILLVISVTYLIIRTKPDTTIQQLALQKNLEEKDNRQPIISDSADRPKTIGDNLLSLKKENSPIEKPRPKSKLPVAESQPQEVINETKSEPTPEVSEGSAISQSAIIDDLAEERELALARDLDESKDDEIAQSKTESRKARSEVLKKSAAPSALPGAGSDKLKADDSITISPKPYVGDVQFLEYLKTNIVYPKEAMDNNVEGEVTINFNVSRDGALSDFLVEKGIGFGCDQELIRVIKAGPAWSPALIKGKSVDQKSSLSYIFTLPK